MKVLLIFTILTPIIFQEYTAIVNNEFAYHPFERKLTKDNLSSHFEVEFKSGFKTRSNKHSRGLDTIFSYSYKNSSFEFIKAPTGKVFFSKADIKDSELMMNDIYVGMPLTAFCDNFQLEQTQDSIFIVRDEEDLVSHSFWFESGSLTQASINNYVD